MRTSMTYTVSFPEKAFTLMQSELALEVGPIKVPDNETLKWLLEEAPKTDKELLRFLNEGAQSLPERTPHTLPIWEHLEWIVAQAYVQPAVVARHVRLLRSALLVAYKANYAYEQSKRNTAIGCFLANDRDMLDVHRRLVGQDWRARFVDAEGKMVQPTPGNTGGWSELLAKAAKIVRPLVLQVQYEAHVPRHGPGAVFPPRTKAAKGRWDPLVVSQLEDPSGVFPRCIHQYKPKRTPVRAYLNRAYTQSERRARMLYECVRGDPNVRSDLTSSDLIEPVKQTLRSRLTRSSGQTVKLTCVPKDARGPRLICIHSAEAVWVQQAHRSALESAIRKVEPFASMIDLTSQLRSQELAMKGSISGKLATLDLKDASDRICRELVQQIFGPDYWADIKSCCADFVSIDGDIQALSKFAPMGNALTFPVQSVLYSALAYACVDSCPENSGDGPSDICVFGDDIIVPSYAASKLVGLLEHCGLVVNSAKSFVTGWFRESCGCDAWGGLEITPIRCRQTAVSTLQDLQKAQAFAHLWWEAGYKRLAERMYIVIRQTFVDALYGRQQMRDWVAMVMSGSHRSGTDAARQEVSARYQTALDEANRMACSDTRRTGTYEAQTLLEKEWMDIVVKRCLFVRVNNPEAAAFCQLSDQAAITLPRWEKETQRYGWWLPLLTEVEEERTEDERHHVDESLWTLFERDPRVADGPVFGQTPIHPWDAPVSVRTKREIRYSFVEWLPQTPLPIARRAER